ncbi:MFS general substrate transporter [Collybia nuda]|uniref:MFS general substrate transporter n=1 Tax=Collybia nuda TaxID=64659 RepID=A0A9P5YDD0_9AGAR|nr:MFS general substrate transporter [Collybia nuda]
MADMECARPVHVQFPDTSECDFKPEGEGLTTAHGSTTQSLASLDDATSHHDYPEGGFKAYLTVFGAFIALFCTFGQMNSFGTYQTWYSDHQLHNLPPSTISWIGSLQLWVFFFSGGPIGHLFDLFGPISLMITGTIVYIFAIMMTSISTQYYQYVLSQGLLFGLGVGLLFYPSLASISTYFSKYRATALGVAAAGSSIGGVIYPIMLQQLFEAVGFGWGVRIAGLVSAVCCVTATLTVTSLSSAKKSGPCANIKTFSDFRYILLAAGSSFVALGLFIPFFYIVEYAQHISLSPQMSFYVLAVMNAGGVFGRIAPAYLSDTVGRFNLLTPSAFFSGLSCLVFWMFAKSLVSLMLFAAAYGFFSGAFISVLTPCVAQISDIRQIGTRIGMLYTIISFPSLVGGPTAGALLVRANGSYNGMILFSGITVVAGSIFILFSKLNIESRVFARV